jgi:hypothetical protein
LFQIYGRFRRAGNPFSLVHIEEQRCPSGRVVSGLDGEEVGRMNLYAIYDKEDRCLFSGDQREIIGYLGMTLGMTSECFRSKLSNMKRGRDK